MLAIEGEQTAQDLLTGYRADRVADAVVLGQGFDFVEALACPSSVRHSSITRGRSLIRT